jgi:pimeloyl-[acyl-carrier protein] methyl ester esterase
MTTPALHLVGGWAHSADALTPLAHALAPDVTVTLHAWDTPLEALPAGTWLGGWSLGTLRLLDAVLADRLHPRGLILLAPTERFWSDDPTLGVSRSALRALTIGLTRRREATLRSFFQNVHAPVALNEDQATAHLTATAPWSDNALRDGLHQLDTLDLRATPPRSDLTLLILHGSEDRIIPPGASAPLAIRWGQHTTRHLLPGHGHAFPLTAPTLTTHLIRPHLFG